jgi:hypothetical protein
MGCSFAHSPNGPYRYLLSPSAAKGWRRNALLWNRPTGGGWLAIDPDRALAVLLFLLRAGEYSGPSVRSGRYTIRPPAATAPSVTAGTAQFCTQSPGTWEILSLAGAIVAIVEPPTGDRCGQIGYSSELHILEQWKLGWRLGRTYLPRSGPLVPAEGAGWLATGRGISVTDMVTSKVVRRRNRWGDPFLGRM